MAEEKTRKDEATAETGETGTVRTDMYQTVNLNGLLMQYPDTWKQLLKFDGIHARLLRKARVDGGRKHPDWKDWVGITTSYQIDTGEYHVGYETGEFVVERANKLTPENKQTETAWQWRVPSHSTQPGLQVTVSMGFTKSLSSSRCNS